MQFLKTNIMTKMNVFLNWIDKYLTISTNLSTQLFFYVLGSFLIILDIALSTVFHFAYILLLFSSRVRTEQSLVRWATPQLHDIDALAKMVDSSLNGMYPAKSLSRFADIIALCVQVQDFIKAQIDSMIVLRFWFII